MLSEVLDLILLWLLLSPHKLCPNTPPCKSIPEAQESHGDGKRPRATALPAKVNISVGPAWEHWKQKSKCAGAPSSTPARSCQAEGPPQPGPPGLQVASRNSARGPWHPYRCPMTRNGQFLPGLGSVMLGSGILAVTVTTPKQVTEGQWLPLGTT